MRQNMGITIVGGGISGFATALALKRLGIDSVVYERTTELSEIGAGILMQPNAMKVLNWLAVGDKVRETGVPLKRVEITNNQLQPVKETKTKLVKDDRGNQTVAIHRDRLQKILYDELPEGTVHLGAVYQDHFRDNDKITISFADGLKVETDILIGADGIHSQVRQKLFPDATLRFSGQTCWRGVADYSLPDHMSSHVNEAWGHNVRFGIAPLSREEVYWFAVANAEPNQKDEPSTLKSDLAGMFKNFHPVVQDLIYHTDLSRITRKDVLDLKPMSAWHDKGVCLIGDAAHATTPNMGQGGCLGIEDAYYLSNYLSTVNDSSRAFACFEQARRKKVDYVVNLSWKIGQVAHSSWKRPLFKVMMKGMPERMLMKQTHDLFAIQENFEGS